MSLLNIKDFNDLNQINFALSTTIAKYKTIIAQDEECTHIIEDAERQLVIFERIKTKTTKAINEYLKR